MNPDWFELKVSVVAAKAQFTLCAVLLGYLLSLPKKNLETTLFLGYLFSVCPFFANDVLYNTVIYSPFHRVVESREGESSEIIVRIPFP